MTTLADAVKRLRNDAVGKAWDDDLRLVLSRLEALEAFRAAAVPVLETIDEDRVCAYGHAHVRALLARVREVQNGRRRPRMGRGAGEAMSTRRNAGDLVRVLGHWCGDLPEPVLARILEGDEPEPCFDCDDPECQEWPNVEIVEGEHAGLVLYHVSECQMEDA